MNKNYNLKNDIDILIGGRDFPKSENDYPSFKKEQMRFLNAQVSRSAFDGFCIMSMDWLHKDTRKFRLFFVLSRECHHLHHFAISNAHDAISLAHFEMRLLGNPAYEHADIDLQGALSLLHEFVSGNSKYNIPLPEGKNAYNFLLELMRNRAMLTEREQTELNAAQFQDISSSFQTMHYAIMAMVRRDEDALKYLASPGKEGNLQKSAREFWDTEPISFTYAPEYILKAYKGSNKAPLKDSTDSDEFMDSFQYLNPHVFRNLKNPIVHQVFYNDISSISFTDEFKDENPAMQSRYRCKTFILFGSIVFFAINELAIDDEGICEIKPILLTHASEYELYLHAEIHDFLTVCDIRNTAEHAIMQLKEMLTRTCVKHEEKNELFFLPQAISDRVCQPVFNAFDSYLFAINLEDSSRLIMHSPSLNGIGFAEMLVFNSELAKYLKVNTRRELLEPVFFDYLASPDLPSFIFYAETLRGYTLLED